MNDLEWLARNVDVDAKYLFVEKGSFGILLHIYANKDNYTKDTGKRDLGHFELED